jgi:hypothetical protein
MVAKNQNVSEANLRLLVESMTGMMHKGEKALEVGNMLIKETVRFRDKLKADTGEILTVGDTRTALEALEEHLDGRELPAKLTPEQRALAQIWIDRITLFGTK